MLRTGIAGFVGLLVRAAAVASVYMTGRPERGHGLGDAVDTGDTEAPFGFVPSLPARSRRRDPND